jgi:hypothetical protein
MKVFHVRSTSWIVKTATCYSIYRQYRDLALLNLGAIFHQSRFPAEAAIILHAAVDHAPLMAPNHFLLGNVYAILGDYNR